MRDLPRNQAVDRNCAQAANRSRCFWRTRASTARWKASCDAVATGATWGCLLNYLAAREEPRSLPRTGAVVKAKRRGVASSAHFPFVGDG